MMVSFMGNKDLTCTLTSIIAWNLLGNPGWNWDGKETHFMFQLINGDNE